jgi:serine/threonine protein kinase
MGTAEFQGPGRAIVAGLEAAWPRVGPYELLRRVGEGGMGIIYHARHVALGREVALKFLWPHLSDRPRSRERFLAEGRAAAAISHPHVVSCYDLGQLGGAWYLVFNWLPGGDAVSLSRSGHGIEERQALQIVRDVARGVAALHQAGIVHRDLKPDNILFDAQGRAVVCDLGIARLPSGERITEEGKAVGTPEYMAPEQARADPAADHRVDIYALGATLYDLLTGHPPYEGASTWAVLTQVVSEPFPDPRLARSGISAQAAAVTLTAAASDPAQRYADAQSMANDIDLILANLPPRFTIPAPALHTRRISRTATSRRAGTWVLVVDADPLLSRFYAERLGRYGLDVQTAGNIADAKSRMQDHAPDLLLLDPILPDGDGLQLVRSLRASPNGGRDAPIIVFVGGGSRDEASAAKAAGANEVLVKSRHPPRQVVEMVRRFLGEQPTAVVESAAKRQAGTPTSSRRRSSSSDSGLLGQHKTTHMRDQFLVVAQETVGRVESILADLPSDDVQGGDGGEGLHACLSHFHSLVGSGNVTGMAPVAALADLAEAQVRFAIDHPDDCTPSFVLTLIQAVTCLNQLLLHPDATSRLPYLAALRVLAVDDDAMQVRIFREAMRLAGLPAVLFDDAREALVASRKHRYALVVSDVLMPGLNGFQFVTSLRQDGRHAATPVIFVTGMADFTSFIGSNMPPYTDVISKPVEVHELATKAMSHLLINLLNQTIAGVQTVTHQNAANEGVPQG